jgi:hypothetical protein
MVKDRGEAMGFNARAFCGNGDTHIERLMGVSRQGLSKDSTFVVSDSKIDCWTF